MSRTNRRPTAVQRRGLANILGISATDVTAENIAQLERQASDMRRKDAFEVSYDAAGIPVDETAWLLSGFAETLEPLSGQHGYADEYDSQTSFWGPA